MTPAERVALIKRQCSDDFPERTRIFDALPVTYKRAVEGWVRSGTPVMSPILIAVLLGAHRRQIPDFMNCRHRMVQTDALAVHVWLYDEAPIACWGTIENVLGWASPLTVKFETDVRRIAAALGIKAGATPDQCEPLAE